MTPEQAAHHYSRSANGYAAYLAGHASRDKEIAALRKVVEDASTCSCCTESNLDGHECRGLEELRKDALAALDREQGR